MAFGIALPGVKLVPVHLFSFKDQWQAGLGALAQVGDPEASLYFPLISQLTCVHIQSIGHLSRCFPGVRLALDDYQLVALASHNPFSVMRTCRHDYPSLQ